MRAIVVGGLLVVESGSDGKEVVESFLVLCRDIIVQVIKLKVIACNLDLDQFVLIRFSYGLIFCVIA